MIRRLFSVFVLAGALALAQCTTMQIQQIESEIGKVQAAVAFACKIIPTVDTIVSVINASAGASIAAIAAVICSAVPPPSSAKFKALPRRAAGGPPTTIGVTNGGITVIGWRV